MSVCLAQSVTALGWRFEPQLCQCHQLTDRESAVEGPSWAGFDSELFAYFLMFSSLAFRGENAG